MSQSVKDYVASCHRCQMSKGTRKPPAGKLHPNLVPEAPWADILVDFMDTPEAGGYDSVLVVVDRFSKEAVFVPTHELPSTVISDQGPQFASTFMMDLSKMLGIKPKLSTAFHPQTDGQTEWLNQEIQQYLRLFINDQQRTWLSWLKIAQFSYNSKRQDSTGHPPFVVTRTYTPRMGVEPMPSKAEATTTSASNIQLVLESTRKALQHTVERMVQNTEGLRSEAPEYSVGQEVWLDTTHVQIDGCPSRKFTEKWIGPYKILSVKPNAVELCLPKTLRIHPVVNVSWVKLYRGPLEGQKVTRPGQVVGVEDRDEEFKVEYIVDSRLKHNRLEFLVHWRGYGDEDHTWEPELNLKGSPDVLRDFYKSHPLAPRKL
ncbi:hypothetical protein PISMIDRAFT_18283 [Pisolithus microcarpus 441]|uniref:Unplaced genomic scaffold scaffold_342, whole genome shotgun sequence n=1 Tax=Pisolithus microcarpus 441 TaxID=765257 RepID=A0A0C9YRX0_9AGAM|nr:hypothetical protein PISMIDRAFT_18283 [Pisolithus microcarpus 441]